MTTEAIALERVSVRRNDRLVLNALSLSLDRGELLYISGRNGAGKTTLLKTVLGLVPPSEGEVRALGLTVGTAAWARRRSGVAYVNQETVQVDFPISAYEVAEVGTSGKPSNRRARAAAVADAMTSVGCFELRNRPYARLSGGEKQKVAIARALAQSADILLLDEPTSSLDGASREELVRLLEHLARERGLAVVVVSHDRLDADRQDWRMVTMDEGRVFPWPR